MKQLTILVLCCCLLACGRAPGKEASSSCDEWKERVLFLEARCDSLQQARAEADPALHTASPEKPAPAQIPLVRGRCQALTLKGLQCKRTAGGGGSRCWQHG